MGPDKKNVIPNPAIPDISFISNVVKNENIIVGEYTYYDDPDGPEHFEEHVTHHYDFIGDKLYIGRFCSIAKGIEFIMNGANHPMAGFTTYPFYIMGNGWEGRGVPSMEELAPKGDTVVGNDVWIGQNVTVMPGVHIGDGAIIGANSVVASDIPPYAIAAGNPCQVKKMRFSDDVIEFLLDLRWWDWDIERITESIDVLAGGDIDELKRLK